MDWSSLLPSVLPSAIAIVGIPLGIYLSGRQAKEAATRNNQDWISQRWWERKADAYSEIIQAIGHINDHNRAEFEKEVQDRTIDDNLWKKLQDQVQQDHEKLRHVADIGAFVISRKSAQILADYFIAMDASVNQTSWHEFLFSRWEALVKCLDEFRDAATEDLRVGGSIANSDKQVTIRRRDPSDS